MVGAKLDQVLDIAQDRALIVCAERLGIRVRVMCGMLHGSRSALALLGVSVGHSTPSGLLHWSVAGSMATYPSLELRAKLWHRAIWFVDQQPDSEQCPP